jgi:uncharacterized protein with PQ loop repeat
VFVTSVIAILAAGWATVMALAPLLQARRMLQRGSSDDVSLGYLLVLLPGFALWVAYGVTSRAFALIGPNALAFAVDSATCVLVVRLRQMPPRRRHVTWLPGRRTMDG